MKILFKFLIFFTYLTLIFIVNNFILFVILILADMVAIKTLKIITKPLSIFKLNNKKVGLMVGIAISMIPILKDEIQQKIYALNSKGYKLKLNNLSIIFKPLFISILKRTNEIEKNLIARGYQE